MIAIAMPTAISAPPPRMSERRAYTLIAADRTIIRYRSRRPLETELRARLHELANQRRRFGYRRLFILPRRETTPLGRLKAASLAPAGLRRASVCSPIDEWTNAETVKPIAGMRRIGYGSGSHDNNVRR
jgi:transposase InsO family protein